MAEAYDGRQVVGMDLHRRRSALVRMSMDGRKPDIGLAAGTERIRALGVFKGFLRHTRLVSRTSITRLSRKASSDRATLDRLLDTVHIGHFAFVADDVHPVVLPTAVVRDGDRVLAHGSTGSRWLRRLAAGAPACLAVTAFDALVVARSAFESSMRYRSAVLFGQCHAITEQDAKRRALDTITDALIPGRSAEVRASTAKELAAVLVLALPIAEWSLKVSEGWPDDPPDDVAGPAWAGVLPVAQRYDQPLAAPDLRDGIPLPASVQRLLIS